MKRNSTIKRWATAVAMLALLVAQVSPAVPVAMAQSGPAQHVTQAAGHDSEFCDTAPTQSQCSGGLLCDHGCAGCWHGFSASLPTNQFTAAAILPGVRFSAPGTRYRFLPLAIPARPPQVILS